MVPIIFELQHGAHLKLNLTLIVGSHNFYSAIPTHR